MTSARGLVRTVSRMRKRNSAFLRSAVRNCRATAPCFGSSRMSTSFSALDFPWKNASIDNNFEYQWRLISLSMTGSDMTLPTAGSFSNPSCRSQSCLYASLVSSGAPSLCSTTSFSGLLPPERSTISSPCRSSLPFLKYDNRGGSVFSRGNPSAPIMANTASPPTTRGWRAEKNDRSHDSKVFVQPSFVFGGVARARNQGYRVYAAVNATAAPTAPAVPKCFIGVDGTNHRLMKPSNMHTALQNDGATVSFTALHTAAYLTDVCCSRILFQLKVRNTIGERVITNTMVERFAVTGPIGI